MRMRKILLGGLVASAAIATPIALASAASAAPLSTTADVAVNVASETPVELPALNSQFTKATLTPSGINNWNYGDAEHVTSYDANGVEQTNFDYTVGHLVWNGVEYAPLVGENTQVGGILYRVNGGGWQALDKPTVVDGKGKIVHIDVVTNDRPGYYFDNTGAESVNVVRTK
jgi:hypothetical protein